MPRAFADICFTESVKNAQTRYGSREANQGFELADNARNELGEREKTFIETRDSFYQATVGDKGWPYVQHRGGPAGFLTVLDPHTLAYADFRGNVQYVSVGNLMHDERVSMILMDYPNRRRLKIWGHARLVHENEEPDLFARVEMASYRAPVERLLVITVDAFDWNCPKHITPRYTEENIADTIKPLQAEIHRLQALLQQHGVTDHE
jgi:predicted pyridoxine 5'-phosphate oxidase superfamily flavin-nucleotide-binding protein